jgi:hypothetical protein
MRATKMTDAKSYLRFFLEQARGVTWALANLKNHVGNEEWDQWWSGHMTELRSDPVAQFFYATRNPMMKKGTLGVEQVFDARLRPSDYEPWPPGARALVVGMSDVHTGVAYEMADGSWWPISVDYGTVRYSRYIVGTPDEWKSHPIELLMWRHICLLTRLIDSIEADLLP